MNKFILFFIFCNLLFSETILLKNGKKLENVKLEKESDDYIIVTTDEDLTIRIEKDKVEEIISTKYVKPIQEPKKYGFVFTQVAANDVVVFGNSLFGERFARRQNLPYTEVPKSLVIGNILNLFTPVQGLKVQLILANPLLGRTNRDSDGYFQSSSNGANQNQLVVDSINQNKLLFDPNQVKRRPEKNGLQDIFIGSISYEWLTKMGTFSTGILIIDSTNYPTNSTVGNYMIGLKLPILEFLNPQLNSFFRFTSEAAGLNQGNQHHRFQINHEFFKGNFFRFIPEAQTGYQYFNNNTDRKSGFTDLTTRLQFFFGPFSVILADTFRPNLYMVDNDRSYPRIGALGDINQNDGNTTNPSKVNGTFNEAVRQGITNSLVGNTPAQDFFIRDYQSQKIQKHLFTLTIGYSLKF